MRKFLVFVALTVAVGACVPKYQIKVLEQQDSHPFYVPMIKAKSVHYAIPYWREGAPVLSKSEAMYQIREWQKEQLHLKRLRKKKYIIIK